ncbi:MAG: hypothetical protein QOF84_937 [Streptomyces sp.]|jgi:hypothetical protein|nr:hypothetical protein [Streptomyces sp.]MDX6346147.1 hypothetical protein [Streptomyces sp.]
MISRRFDLTAPSTELFREIGLRESRVLQSFSFDNANGRLYVVGLVQPGRRLAGETRSYSGPEREANGDLFVSCLDLTGAVVGRMYLRGFGHGVSIAAEPSGDGAFLWTETDAVQAWDARKQTHIGWGSKLARFAFTDGAVLTPDSPGLTTFSPVPGADRTTVAVDPVSNRLAVRYRAGGSGSTFAYGLYDLEAFKAGTFTPLATVGEPDDVGIFQGFTSLGGYLYLIDGTTYEYDAKGHALDPDGNTYLTGVSWDTGEQVERRLTRAGNSLYFREPEGLAIQLPDPGDPEAARLVMGFASEASATSTGKKASFYYKAALV